jgi:L-alanine-DL-glutamate epimerase-like enolase superfamily enzyme
MELSGQALLLELRHPFRLATNTRTHTNAVLTEIRQDGAVGYGEAAMPPYYGENQETALAFLSQAAPVIAAAQVPALNQEAIAQIMQKIDALAPGNNAAKASVDIALHHLWAAQQDKPLGELLHINPATMPLSSFTLGIDRPEILQQKLSEAAGFRVIKIKLGSDDDRQIIRSIRALSDLPIYADANQGWHDRQEALDLVHWLAEQNVQLIEQPFRKDDLESAAWLSARSPIPVFADESFQRLSDLERVADHFNGVNIKLMKCTGISEALRAQAAARARGLKLMIGCMTETSCGIVAAAAIAPLFDYADIDGCWLISNNPFEMPDLVEGKVLAPNRKLEIVNRK